MPTYDVEEESDEETNFYEETDEDTEWKSFYLKLADLFGGITTRLQSIWFLPCKSKRHCFGLSRSNKKKIWF